MFGNKLVLFYDINSEDSDSSVTDHTQMSTNCKSNTSTQTLHILRDEKGNRRGEANLIEHRVIYNNNHESVIYIDTFRLDFPSGIQQYNVISSYINPKPLFKIFNITCTSGKRKFNKLRWEWPSQGTQRKLIFYHCSHPNTIGSLF